MIPRPAHYLLRFDDLCPTHDRERWRRFLPILAEFRVKPILAVVPDNRDPELVVNEADRGFWAEMRELEADGASIGLHGFRHLWAARGRSLVPLHDESEFAGVPEAMQRQWIHEGLEILRDYGLNPTIWVAPRHGFDRATLRVLLQEGIGVLSDGFAQRPFLRGGVVWIPQQLWGPQHKRSGLWTICLHSNTATDAQIKDLREFLSQHRSQLTTVERVRAEFEATQLTLAEQIGQEAATIRIRTRRSLKTLLAAFDSH
jgi:predicted deacetylase